ncbi:hypothetical protein GCM10012275_48830 [Longimycelium tulufanense]|uniref:Uncharacterized protein n=1 Tax=Longimycelium tulufanense TaxID=907463 RepID=A0A8J3FX85_9PSEU|nr:hypothetical protein [Longimycelium tulufanense]GGM72486.1 hypothetical protein GCM10012275_48830 [Longimycelium tulufanense]
MPRADTSRARAFLPVRAAVWVFLVLFSLLGGASAALAEPLSLHPSEQADQQVTVDQGCADPQARSEEPTAPPEHLVAQRRGHVRDEATPPAAAVTPPVPHVADQRARTVPAASGAGECRTVAHTPEMLQVFLS